MSEPTYFDKRWHYPEEWTSAQIIEHALTFALDDYERANKSGRYPGHPYTQGPEAIRNALKEAKR